MVQPDGLLAGGPVAPVAPIAPVGGATTDQTEPERLPDVTLAVPASSLPLFLQGGQAALLKHVKIDGDAEFAAVIAKLAERLRWEPEEDLAALIGDGPAYRAAGVARALTGQARRTGRNLAESVAEYWLDEKPQLVRHAALDDLSTGIVHAREALERVEKRLERLERTAGGRPLAVPAAATAAVPAMRHQPSPPRGAR
jgi:ubiquinone biosynthesis protein UbiJ